MEGRGLKREDVFSCASVFSWTIDERNIQDFSSNVIHPRYISHLRSVLINKIPQQRPYVIYVKHENLYRVTTETKEFLKSRCLRRDVNIFLGSDDTISLVATTRGVRDGLFLLDESCTIFTNSIL